MKNAVLYSLVIVMSVLSACDDRLDFIADVNKAPALTLLREGVPFSGTADYKMKDEIKGPGTELFYITLLVEDPEGFDGTVSAIILSGPGKLVNAGGNELPSSFSYTNQASQTIYFDALDSDGVTTIRISAIDNLGKETKADVSINSFLNKLPVASWNYTNIKLNDPYEYEFDATTSIDQDADLGGAIAGYEWTVNGNVFTVGNAKINYILSKASPGGTTYNIKLRVLDNNGQYSTVSEKYITVN